MVAQLVTNESGKKARRLRSPSYPGITLEAALKYAKDFYNLEKRNPANIGVALQHWGFKPKSGGGLVAIAALKSFGLLSDTGSGKDRNVRLTDLALRIILDTRPESPEREQAIKEAALKPTIHSALWSKYGADLPSDENLRHELIFDRKFNDNTVGDFIEEFKETIQLAKLGSSDIISGVEEDMTEGNEMLEAQEVPRRSNPTATLVRPSGDVSRPSTNLAEISVPVGTTEEGKPIFAHVRFDAPLKKGMLASLKQLLDALEKNLA